MSATPRGEPAPLRRPGGPATLGPRAQSFLEEHGLGDERHAGAADEHQVRRAPEGHVLPEEAMPEVVEREAGQRERPAGGQQHAADRSTATAAEPDRRGTRARSGQRHRQHAGGEDAEEPPEDQVVGGVGERPRVTAVVDVQGDVPVHAEQRDEQRRGRERRGQCGPAREPGDALRGRERALEPCRTARAVTGDQPPESGQDEGRGSGRRHDLIQRGAPGRLRGGEAAQRGARRLRGGKHRW
jgi:hypothetical protein